MAHMAVIPVTAIIIQDTTTLTTGIIRPHTLMATVINDIRVTQDTAAITGLITAAILTTIITITAANPGLYLRHPAFTGAIRPRRFTTITMKTTIITDGRLITKADGKAAIGKRLARRLRLAVGKPNRSPSEIGAAKETGQDSKTINSSGRMAGNGARKTISNSLLSVPKTMAATTISAELPTGWENGPYKQAVAGLIGNVRGVGKMIKKLFA